MVNPVSISNRSTFSKLISLGSLVAMAGFILSGPLAFFIVRFIRPQPMWESARTFAANYHVIQDLPYYFGFFLIGGMLMLSAGHYLNFQARTTTAKFHLLIAFGWTIAFVTLISFNYICQTTFIRNLVHHYDPKYDFAIETFSMANPLSFCWANEMWGYAFLGISTILTAGYYRDKSLLISNLMTVNGVVSVGSAIWTIIDASWVMTITGLIGYFLWNILMILMMILVFNHSRKTNSNSA